MPAPNYGSVKTDDINLSSIIDFYKTRMIFIKIT